MNRFELTTFCLVVALGIAGCHQPEAVSRSASEQAAAAQAADEKACMRRSGNARDVCMEEAKARANVAVAAGALASNPSDQHRDDLATAKADADYAVANERCDDLSGNTADVCRKEAERAFAVAEADAELAATIVDAGSTERETNSEAAETALETTDAARDDAADTKRDADLALAHEKCDDFAGDTKTDCVERAEAAYARR